MKAKQDNNMPTHNDPSTRSTYGMHICQTMSLSHQVCFDSFLEFKQPVFKQHPFRCRLFLE